MRNANTSTVKLPSIKASSSKNSKTPAAGAPRVPGITKSIDVEKKSTEMTSHVHSSPRSPSHKRIVGKPSPPLKPKDPAFFSRNTDGPSSTSPRRMNRGSILPIASRIESKSLNAQQTRSSSLIIKSNNTSDQKAPAELVGKAVGKEAHRSTTSNKVNLNVAVDHSTIPAKINVKWDYVACKDEEYDLRQWDFLTLHQSHLTAGEYEASRYMLSHQSGEIDFSAPIRAGSYAISVARDRVVVAKQMAGPRRIEYLTRSWVDITSTIESLCTLNTVVFEFDPRDGNPNYTSDSEDEFWYWRCVGAAS